MWDDDGGGEPRDGVRPRRGGPGGVHGPRADRRAGAAGRDFRNAVPRADAGVHQPDPATLMGNWDRFVETFFNAKVMWKYLPDILSGSLVY